MRDYSIHGTRSCTELGAEVVLKVTPRTDVLDIGTIPRHDDEEKQLEI